MFAEVISSNNSESCAAPSPRSALRSTLRFIALQRNSSLKALEITLTFEQKPMRIYNRHFGKTNAITGPKLSRNAKIDSDHVPDFGITTDGLAIAKKQN